MLLHFYTAVVEGKTLHELFGLAPSTFCRVLRRAEEALARTLRRIPDALIRWPSKSGQAHWASKANEREPLVQGVFGFVDGKDLRVQEPSNVDLQNAQFNGWLHCVFVTGVLCYGLDGTLIWGRHNCPGSWNDGEMSRGLQDILADDTKVGPGMKVASDSAFPVGGRCAGRIITPLKEGDLERQPANCRLAMQTISDCITSLRQAAEWGMGSATKMYRHLLLPLPYNPALRSVRLENIFRLYNFRLKLLAALISVPTLGISFKLPGELLSTPSFFTSQPQLFTNCGTFIHRSHHRHEVRCRFGICRRSIFNELVD
ncbi:hypothetical protein H257_04663 [Aphanomyces astaci]|uniref:DDE Tnp4 domain-containing protein n=1 Tax=Aphanomyces astaci TaxID=112090 RepID=W4GV26_APHAT|nr:hypothetical protein H257_04663 [Aphanomyces astaci]ETV82889.1 hypothetical protein H257_04663 [Aphanomyces astaci]|eukprot:XP_009827560.1 hypothetical protein H257_04663 [Aphanomyces astaci]